MFTLIKLTIYGKNSEKYEGIGAMGTVNSFVHYRFQLSWKTISWSMKLTLVRELDKRLCGRESSQVSEEREKKKYFEEGLIITEVQGMFPRINHIEI